MGLRAYLEDFSNTCYEIAEKKGWHADEPVWRALERSMERAPEIAKALDGQLGQDVRVVLTHHYNEGRVSKGIPVMRELMLIVTEIAEAAEDYRNSKIPLTSLFWEDQNGVRQPMTLDDAQQGRKPEGFGSELADGVIRLFHLAKRLNIDIVTALECKMAYNTTRPYRHGGKRA
jgi:NTP pyrophosphatase (non-canonical NTP hydrolase)